MKATIKTLIIDSACTDQQTYTTTYFKNVPVEVASVDELIRLQADGTICGWYKMGEDTYSISVPNENIEWTD